MFTQNTLTLIDYLEDTYEDKLGIGFIESFTDDQIRMADDAGEKPDMDFAECMSWTKKFVADWFTFAIDELYEEDEDFEDWMFEHAPDIHEALLNQNEYTPAEILTGMTVESHSVIEWL